MGLRFVKLEGAGNDLILVDVRSRRRVDFPALAIRICERHCGVGSDGLLTLEAAPGGLPLMRMFNPDGTEDFCGNGLRCAAAYLHHRGECRGDSLVLLTPRGSHAATVRPTGTRTFSVDIALVVPQFAPEQIPARLPGERVIERPLEVGGRVVQISSVSVGTAHTVIFGEREVEDAVFVQASPVIETHPIFPQRTNVLWCRAEGRRRIKMRIWERGVGETYSCGTGTCAAVVIGRAALGRTDDRAEVVTKGGVLAASWDGKGPVRLTGPARIVYEGNWEVE